MKGFCQDNTTILGTSTRYREKRSHHRMINSQWTWKHIATKYI